jgi:leader peptidase (prepilin peptidase)/N-methyltransferase
MAAVLALGALGGIVGSFLNVVIYRVPAGRSIVSPASACGSCGHEVRWYDNVPVLSWLVLRGRCRDCASPISVRYPLVELGAAVFFAIVAWRFASAAIAVDGGAAAAGWIELAAFLYLAAISIALAAIDLDTQRLPNVIVLPAYAVAAAAFLASAALGDGWSHLAGAAIGAVALFVVYAIPAFLRPGAMGMGDVKLAGVLGAFLGWIGADAWAVGTIAGFLIGGLVGVGFILAGRGRGARVPFGPWLLAGAWIGILAGPELATWYLGLFGLS